MNILVFHNLEEFGQSRANAIDYLFSFERYAAQHNYLYHSITFPIVEAIRQFPFDGVIFHSSSLGVVTFRPRLAFSELKQRLAFLADLPAVKLAFPQDDYNHSDILDEWISELKCNAVFTPILDHHRKLYPRSSQHADFFGVLTGYVDDRRVEEHRRLAKPFRERTRLIVQRVTFYPPRGGRFSRIKGETAEMVKRAAAARGLEGIDISTAESDVLKGEDWFKVLGDAKFCLGAESGVSLWDPTGEIDDCTTAYLSTHPDATFEEVEAACFAERDGQHVFSAVSPRLFEAALSRCCQILVEGSYVRELKPYEHYIPLTADGSNLDEVFELIGDDRAAERRAAATYAALIENPEYRYSRFVAGVMEYLAKKTQLEPRVTTTDAEFRDLWRTHRRQLLSALTERERAARFHGQALVSRVAGMLDGQFGEPCLRPDRARRVIDDLTQDLLTAREDLSAANHRNGVLCDEADALRDRIQALCKENRGLEERLAGAIECPGLPPPQRDLIERGVRLAERWSQRSADLPFHVKIAAALLRRYVQLHRAFRSKRLR